MATLCCDRRSHIRTSALTSLQRALLFHDLQTLSSSEWEAAFTHVLFPMLDQLLIPSQPGERTAMEETRTRAATLLGKVYLQHLTPLTTLQTFTVSYIDFPKHFYKLNLILWIIQISNISTQAFDKLEPERLPCLEKFICNIWHPWPLYKHSQ